MMGRTGRSSGCWSAGLLLAALVCAAVATAAEPDLEKRLAACAGLGDPAERLRCYDGLAAGQAPPAAGKTEHVSTEPPGGETAAEKSAEPSVMTRHWDLDPANRRRSFVLRPYRMNYFLPVAYNASPNDETNLEYDPAAKAQFNEAKFQLSFKAKVWEDVLQGPLSGVYDSLGVVKGVDVWIAYTQLCFWQLYNSAFSSPFRDTNYEPELLVNLRTDYELLGFKGRYVQVGFNHQSNGRSRPLSRSWNRIVANIGLERKNLGVQLKTWYRLTEDAEKDDNPDLTRYLGYGELWVTWIWEKQRFALMLRNNLRQNNLGAVQVDWSIPPLALGRLLFGSFVPKETLEKYLTDKVSFYIQYFNGYGEGLMDYNKSVNRIGAGFMLAEWN
ncbi:MAG: phospholipase A [Deltaproteobacteria bacterium]|jgi:phospholipase A1|nr:phospholipase A [Syntrophaceae bacterium]